MPTMYKLGEYDLAGFSLGVVEHNLILPRIDTIVVGDLVIGLPSSGLHSNGFSLIHKIMEMKKLNYNEISPFSDCKKTYGLYMDIINMFFFYFI